jgi:1-acyl-sn-glycerol-3-phosphate acyltransferase
MLSFLRLAGFFAFTGFGAACVLTQSLWTRSTSGRDRVAGRWIHRWARVGCWLAGVRVTVVGKPPAGGTLIVPNHLGYADVLAMGLAVPCYFAPKSDAGSWPVVGPVVRVARLPLVERRPGDRSLAQVAAKIGDLLADGHNVCVFLEGTSTGGDKVLPFRPALVQAALDRGAPLLPTALVWSADDPRVEVAEHVAYWKDHVFGPHAWAFFGLRGVRVEIRFGEPIPTAGETDRKALAQRARAQVVALMGFPAEASPESVRNSPEADAALLAPSSES